MDSIGDILDKAQGKGKDHTNPTDKHAFAKAVMYGLGYRDRTLPKQKLSNSGE